MRIQRRRELKTPATKKKKRNTKSTTFCIKNYGAPFVCSSGIKWMVFFFCWPGELSKKSISESMKKVGRLRINILAAEQQLLRMFRERWIV